jgi:hypothetical protein
MTDNATVHLGMEVWKQKGQGWMKTKCGVKMAQSAKNVGTVWHTRVTCKKCLRFMEKEVEEVVNEDDIEW